MKLRCLVIFLLFLVISTPVYNQELGPVISGYVKDAGTNRPMSQVNISVQGTRQGTITDNSGFYSMKINHLPAVVVFTSIGYTSDKITITESKNIKYHALLSPSVNELKPVSIYAEKIVNLLKDKPLFVTDYDFQGDDILLFAYRDKKVSKPELILVNTEGDTLSCKSIMQAEKFYRDCLDNLYLLTRDNAYQVYIESGIIRFLYPTPVFEFHESMDPLVAAVNDKFFIHQYHYRNQVLEYYYFRTSDSTFHDFRVIEDSKGLRMLYDTDRWGNFGYVNEFHKRFEELFFADPIFAPLIILHDSLVIFNFVDGQIEYYTEEGSLLYNTPISFQKDKNWKEKVYVDGVTGKVYTHFRKNGISTLREIKLKTGQLGKSIEIPDFVFIDNIKIRDGVVYFLYKENIHQEYQQLYKMHI